MLLCHGIGPTQNDFDLPGLRFARRPTFTLLAVMARRTRERRTRNRLARWWAAEIPPPPFPPEPAKTTILAWRQSSPRHSRVISARLRPAFSIIWKRFGPVSSIAIRSISRICSAVTEGTSMPEGVEKVIEVIGRGL